MKTGPQKNADFAF